MKNKRIVKKVKVYEAIFFGTAILLLEYIVLTILILPMLKL